MVDLLTHFGRINISWKRLNLYPTWVFYFYFYFWTYLYKLLAFLLKNSSTVHSDKHVYCLPKLKKPFLKILIQDSGKESERSIERV